MKKLIWIFAAVLSLGFVACSEEEEVGEFEGNWQERNEAYIDSIGAIARANEGTTPGKWKVLHSYHYSSAYSSQDNQEYVFAKILKNGTGTDTPLYSDSVTVSYRGRLIPTTSYKDGYVFDQNYYGDLITEKDGAYVLDEDNAKIMVPTGFLLSSVVDGWTTALQKMHAGDIWRLYIPQSLGYGSSTSNDAIPAYSTLIFDVYVQKVIHK